MILQVSVSTKGALLSGKAPQIVQRNLDAAILKVVLLLVKQVKARTPQGALGSGKGGLIDSILPDVQGKGTPLVKGIVMSAHKYAAVIEKGRKPGKGIASAVPGDKYVSPLIPWVKAKLGISGKDAERVAYLVGRKIKAEGFEGAHMFEKAWTENQGTIQSIFDRHGITIAKELSE
jgi:hypothetical protein